MLIWKQAWFCTEKSREIAGNSPFCILRATQIHFVARLVALKDTVF